MGAPCIEVVVNVPARRLDKPFHYLVPEHLQEAVMIGQRVQVPLGSRHVEGFVTGLCPDHHPSATKPIRMIIDPVPAFTPRDLALARWMAEYYLCPVLDALLALARPETQAKSERVLTLAGSVAAVDQVLPELAGRSPRQAELLRFIRDHQPVAWQKAAEQLKASLSVLRRLEARGLVRVETRVVDRDPYRATTYTPTPPLVLTSAQKKALNVIASALRSGQSTAFLLHGVTGSGKTEVYLQAIDETLKLGKQAIVMVPEIALTPQMVERFKSRFGARVAVWHSRLSGGERGDIWHKIAAGAVDIVVGARSAIFAPLARPGLMIIDEEHEFSYKQEEDPKYHAREVALARAAQSGAVVVMGSATPSLESYYRAQRGEFTLLELPGRIEARPLPPVVVVDMRAELQAGHKSMFSRSLQAAVADRLARREQTILLLNRRGFATFVLCRECGLVMRCPRCDVSLTYHVEPHRLLCHYCHYRAAVPDTCPRCGSVYIRYFGTGTQKVEDELKRTFPTARVMRMDVDTTGAKDAHAQMLGAFARGEVDILLGTQMIAKGLDFPNVTLVGVITADTALNLPDFRAGERTFQLLTQVAGRAGRGDRPGEVIIQTYAPEHYSIVAAKDHDYRRFYDQEIILRQELAYPPFTHLVRIVVTGDDACFVQAGAEELAMLLRGNVPPGADSGQVAVLGPVAAALSRIKNTFRWQIVLKGPDVAVLRDVAKRSVASLPGRRRIIIDVDPYSML